MSGSPPPNLADFDRLVAERMPAWTAELEALCRIRSEAADPRGLREAADWVATRLGGPAPTSS